MGVRLSLLAPQLAAQSRLAGQLVESFKCVSERASERASDFFHYFILSIDPSIHPLSIHPSIHRCIISCAFIRLFWGVAVCVAF